MIPFSPEMLMLLAMFAPLAAAVLIPLVSKAPNVREGVTLATAALVAVAVWSLLPAALRGEEATVVLASVGGAFDIALSLEPLGMIFALVAGTLWLVNSIYSIGYMRGNNEPRQTSFYVCFAVAISATMGVAFSKNLFTLFSFYELLTLSTYPLVTHKGTTEAMRAGRVYLMLLLSTSMALLLPGIVAVAVIAGGTDFVAGGVLQPLAEGENGPLLLALLLAVFAFGIGKAALMPMHFWLPAAMVAPTPVSALLHAVAVVKAGVFSILKVVVYTFGVDTLDAAGAGTWLAWAAGATILIASVIALRQDNLKRRLAYSTVSQLSYVVMAAAVLTPISAIGAAFHIAAHALSKITLFFAAGSIYTAAHKTEISQLNGIGWKMPWTMTAFAIGALGMIGVPPTAAFISKWFMLQGAAGAEQWGGVAVIILSTVLNALYFLPIVYRAFFLAPDGTPIRLGAGAPPLPRSLGAAATDDHGEAPAPIVMALTTTAALSVLLFLFPEPIYALARRMAGFEG